MVAESCSIYVTLRLFFLGLLAFVPNEPVDGRMTVLLLDARHPPHASDGCPLHSHTPMLLYEADKCDEQCRPAYGLCGCELSREQICLPDYGAPGPPLPQDELATLARMRKSVGSCSRVREDCLAARNLCTRPLDVHEDEHVSELLAARLDFRPDDEGEVCRPAGDGEFSFQPLVGRRPFVPIRLRAWRQPLAEVIRMDETIRLHPGQPVTLSIVSFDRNEIYPLKLPKHPQGCGSWEKPCRYDLIVANVPRPHAEETYGRCATGTEVARDFELFHDLAAKPMRMYRRPVPQRRIPPAAAYAVREEVMTRELPCGSEALAVFLESLLRTGTTRDICPPALMSN